MRTLATELGPYAERLTGPRFYADANVPAGVVAFMRQRLAWDVLHVIEDPDLVRAPDIAHFRMARQLHRTLLTIDRDYLDNVRFPPGEGSGVLVVWAANEHLLKRSLEQVDRQMFRGAHGGSALPLAGRKLLVEPGWTGDTAR